MIVHRLSLDDDSSSVLMRTYLNDWLKPITCLKCEYFACAHRYVCVSLIVPNRQFGQRCYGHYAWLTMSATGLASFFVLSDSSVSVSRRYIFVAYREWHIASWVLFQLALKYWAQNIKHIATWVSPALARCRYCLLVNSGSKRHCWHGYIIIWNLYIFWIKWCCHSHSNIG